MIHACLKHRRPALATIGKAKLRQTWDSTIRKAGEATPESPEYEWLLEIADKAAPAVKLAFLEALRRARSAVDEAALRDALARRDVAAAMRALGVEANVTAGLGAGLPTPLEDAFLAAGRQTGKVGATVGMRFDITNPKTADFLRTYNFNLIRQISDNTREGIRRVIQDAFRFGGHPYEQARIIRSSIGLTEDQAATVDNFRNLLVNRDRDALGRALRDRRFDRTLQAALGEARTRELSDEQIARMVDRYRERYIGLRAETIARTETMRASNAAQNMAWAQAANDGLIDVTVMRRYWLVTPDDRLCDYCEGVRDLNPGGVTLDDDFQTDLGPVPYPPLHPNCRCITFIAPAGRNAKT